jgi:ABC-type transport system involved in multi-copper enzyme maturation permease subunit
VALTALAAGVAATHHGADRADSYRGGAATILLLLGLAVAVVLGATAVNREGDSGFLGLLVGAGLPRGELALVRLGTRLVALLAVVAVWGIAFQAGSLVLGRGLDGPLAVHTLSMVENLILVLVSAAAVSTVLGPLVSGIVGVGIFVVAQAVVNLKAASDQSLIGAVARPIVRTAYYVFPRAVASPMIVDLQARGQGSAAAPRLEINGALAVVPAAGWATILWTLLWCALFAGLVVTGLRRRAL